MHFDNPSKKLLLAMLLAATNIFSFAFGITFARPGAQQLHEVAAPLTTTTTSTKASSKPKVEAKRTASTPAPSPSSIAPNPVPPVHPAAPPVVAPAGSPIAGKGMWIYEFDRIGRGNPIAIVAAAKRFGLTHLYVRAGTSRSGLDTFDDVVRILPVAHAAGIKVIPWFFPYLIDPAKDVQRTIAVLRTNIKGHQVDGFAADIETRAEGTKLSARRMRAYIDSVRRAVPNAYMILVPPRPNRYTIKFYPYHLTPRFNAVAPMVYWGRFDPKKTTADAVSYLKRYRRPIAPIGQVYDMGPEGGPKGRPKAPALRRFMNEAMGRGSIGFSFWSWQHSDMSQWHAIRLFPLR